MTISRIWHAFGLRPHRSETFKLSPDPQLIDKVRDIVGLYINPPEHAVVLCVDEKSQIQALDRTAPMLPMQPGQAERRTHDYRADYETTAAWRTSKRARAGGGHCRRSRSPARRGVHQGRGQPVLGDRSGRPKSRGGAQEGRKGQGGWDRPTLDHARNASAEAGQKPVRRCNTSTVRPRHDAKLCANRGATYGFPDTPSRPRRERNRRRRRRRGERQERADAASVATIRRGTRGRSRRLNGTGRGAEPGLVAQPLHGPDNQVRALNASGDDDRTDSGLDIGKQAGRRPLRQPLGSEGTGIGYEEHAASRLDRTVNPRRGPRQSEQGRARPANEPRQSSGSGLQ